MEQQVVCLIDGHTYLAGALQQNAVIHNQIYGQLGSVKKMCKICKYYVNYIGRNRGKSNNFLLRIFFSLISLSLDSLSQIFIIDSPFFHDFHFWEQGSSKVFVFDSILGKGGSQKSETGRSSSRQTGQAQDHLHHEIRSTQKSFT